MAKLTIQGSNTNPLTIGGTVSRADANIIVSGGEYVKCQEYETTMYSPTLSLSADGAYLAITSKDSVDITQNDLTESTPVDPHVLRYRTYVNTVSGKSYEKLMKRDGGIRYGVSDTFKLQYESVSNGGFSSSGMIASGSGLAKPILLKNAGLVHIFGNGSSPLQTLTNPDGDFLDNFFGRKVLVSGDSSIIIVGAPSVTVTPTVHVYTKPVSTWVRLTTLAPVDAQTSGLFGDNLVCSNTGSCIAVAEPNYSSAETHHAGRIHVYDSHTRNDIIYPPYQTETNFGSKMDITSNGNTIIVGGQYNVYMYTRNISDEWDLVRTITPPNDVSLNASSYGIKCISLSGNGENIAVTYYRNEIDPYLLVNNTRQVVAVFQNILGSWKIQDLLFGRMSPSLITKSHYHMIAETDGQPYEKYGKYGSYGQLRLLRGKDIGIDQIYDYDIPTSYRNLFMFTVKNLNVTSNTIFNYVRLYLNHKRLTPPYDGSFYNGAAVSAGSFGILGSTDPVTGMSVIECDVVPQHRFIDNTSNMFIFGTIGNINHVVDAEDGFGDNIQISNNGDHIYFTSREPKLVHHYARKSLANMICDVSSYTGLPTQYVASSAGPEQSIKIRTATTPDIVFLIPMEPNPNKQVMTFTKKFNQPYTFINEESVTYDRDAYKSLPVTMPNVAIEYENGTIALDSMEDTEIELGIKQYNQPTNSYDQSFSNSQYNVAGVEYNVVSLQEDGINIQVKKYVGTGTNTETYVELAHDLGVIPSMIMIKQTSNRANWMIWHKDFPNGTVCNTTAVKPFKVGAANTVSYLKPTATNIHIYGDATQNLDDQDYVAYIFAETSDQQIKAGKYTGTGSSINIPSGSALQPVFMMIKNITTDSPWVLVNTRPEEYVIGGKCNVVLLDGSLASQSLSSVSLYYSSGGATMTSSDVKYNAVGNEYAYIMFMGGHSS